ncbi:uncharacterized protein LACBIDRAFT_329748 [Laccaria bicolor S238N-H82]|uniref:Predicted protein n=1 Tax=Laccaria bicolor (strain S238N-H82 / ATCC MYA-4686) TaxID=486041 RepID=B0DJ39_LACBS|nr:uncharacterized protein LACBIDRAFT_329748 [Laccaria bicolor S238N-H82]EDR05337.1 predicted protein [Laccaria bicolor S238N-H82]|eukprot:XP_001883895.1 predicted protein [Laccaria bicolor S238N-H82]
MRNQRRQVSPGSDLDYRGDSDSDEDDSDSDEEEYNLPTKRKVGESTHLPLSKKKRKTDRKKYESQSTKRTQQAANPPPRAPHRERLVARAVIPPLNTVRLPGKMRTGFVFLDNHCCDCASVPSRSHKRCQVLTFYGFYYHSELELVICPTHNRGVTPDLWLSHVQQSHTDLSGQAREKRHILPMIQHVAESFGLISSTSDLNLPSSISQPITVILPYDGVRPSIAGRFPCPVSNCGDWATVSYGKTMSYHHQLSKHIQTKHGQSIRDFPGVAKSPLWTQMLMLRPKVYHVFRLPPDWSPPGVTQMTEPIEPAIAADPPAHYQEAAALAQTQAPWMKTIGWFAYREACGNPSFGSLWALTAIPSKKSIGRGGRKWLESGLHQIFEFCFEYLVNAEQFLATCHEGVRDAITYKTLTTGKYREYSRALSRTIALSMRLLHQNIHRGSGAGAISLLLAGNQLEGALNLYTAIIKARGLPDPELPDVVHKFCVTLLKPGDLSPSDALACPTDQVLFLLGVRPQEMYAPASSVKSTCSALQHCLRSVMIHIWYEATKPLETNADASNTEFAEEAPPHPDDSEDENLSTDEFQEEYIIQDSEDEQDQHEDVDDELLLEKIMNEVYTYRQDCDVDQRSTDHGNPSPEQAAASNSQSLIPLINEEEPWLTIRTAGGCSTPFSRLHYVWLKVDRYAREETGSTQFNSSGDGHLWSFGRLGAPPKQIDMRAWAAACKEADTNFRDAVLSLAMSDADFLENSMRLMRKIKDEGIRLAPHRQVQNLRWMGPVQSQLRKLVFDHISAKEGEIQVDLRQANCWLEQEQMALDSLANILVLSTGVSFRGWQLSSVRFDCSESMDRNVWIVDNTFIATHPKAKQRNREFAPTLVAFPKKLFSYIAHLLAQGCLSSYRASQWIGFGLREYKVNVSRNWACDALSQHVTGHHTYQGLCTTFKTQLCTFPAMAITRKRKGPDKEPPSAVDAALPPDVPGQRRKRQKKGQGLDNAKKIIGKINLGKRISKMAHLSLSVTD